MAVSISTNGYETIIFAWQGKTMIGKIWSSVPTEDKATGTIIKEVVGDDVDYYMIHNPCEIVFKITKPKTGSATLDWDLIPFYYKDLIADSGVSYSAFAFPKSQVSISNIGGTTIHPSLLAAYAELC